MANVIGTLRTAQSFGRRAAIAKIVIGANRATQARIAGAHGAPLLAGKIARQRSDFGSVGLSAVRMSGGLVGTSAPGWNKGMAGSQSFCAAWMRASTLAEDRTRLALPIQPQVQRAWLRCLS
jgi:hypothetical protein